MSCGPAGDASTSAYHARHVSAATRGVTRTQGCGALHASTAVIRPGCRAASRNAV